jgi:hypothetical protein
MLAENITKKGLANTQPLATPIRTPVTTPVHFTPLATPPISPTPTPPLPLPAIKTSPFSPINPSPLPPIKGTPSPNLGPQQIIDQQVAEVNKDYSRVFQEASDALDAKIKTATSKLQKTYYLPYLKLIM